MVRGSFQGTARQGRCTGCGTVFDLPTGPDTPSPPPVGTKPPPVQHDRPAPAARFSMPPPAEPPPLPAVRWPKRSARDPDWQSEPPPRVRPQRHTRPERPAGRPGLSVDQVVTEGVLGLLYTPAYFALILVVPVGALTLAFGEPREVERFMGVAAAWGVGLGLAGGLFAGPVSLLVGTRVWAGTSGRRHAVRLGVMAGLAVLILVANGRPRPAREIEAVLAADRAAAARLHQSVSTGRDQRKPAMRQYVADLGRIPTAICPADFQQAFRRHVRAWEDLQAFLGGLPDPGLEGMLVGALNYLAGEEDGGVSRLTAEERARLTAVRDTWDEVAAVGARHGAKVPPR